MRPRLKLSITDHLGIRKQVVEQIGRCRIIHKILYIQYK